MSVQAWTFVLVGLSFALRCLEASLKRVGPQGTLWDLSLSLSL